MNRRQMRERITILEGQVAASTALASELADAAEALRTELHTEIGRREAEVQQITAERNRAENEATLHRASIKANSARIAQLEAEVESWKRTAGERLTTLDEGVAWREALDDRLKQWQQLAGDAIEEARKWEATAGDRLARLNEERNRANWLLVSLDDVNADLEIAERLLARMNAALLKHHDRYRRSRLDRDYTAFLHRFDTDEVAS